MHHTHLHAGRVVGRAARGLVGATARAALLHLVQSGGSLRLPLLLLHTSHSRGRHGGRPIRRREARLVPWSGQSRGCSSGGGAGRLGRGGLLWLLRVMMRMGPAAADSGGMVGCVGCRGGAQHAACGRARQEAAPARITPKGGCGAEGAARPSGSLCAAVGPARGLVVGAGASPPAPASALRRTTRHHCRRSAALRPQLPAPRPPGPPAHSRATPCARAAIGFHFALGTRHGAGRAGAACE